MDRRSAHTAVGEQKTCNCLMAASCCSSTARALGTRFCVRTEGPRSHVSVLEGQVVVAPQMLQQSTTLDAGQRQSFKLNRFDDPQRFEVAAMSWDKGMLLANNMRLDELLGELSRYRPGVLRCHPDGLEPV